jgi:hypothetical protein
MGYRFGKFVSEGHASSLALRKDTVSMTTMTMVPWVSVETTTKAGGVRSRQIVSSPAGSRSTD